MIRLYIIDWTLLLHSQLNSITDMNNGCIIDIYFACHNECVVIVNTVIVNDVIVNAHINNINNRVNEC